LCSCMVAGSLIPIFVPRWRIWGLGFRV
jgi:hypothetical protein